MNIGRSLPRREDAKLLTGAGAFLDDLKPDAVTYARFVRSTVAHARILGVDTTAARQSDGVLAVLTATDLDLPPLEAPLDNPAARPLPRPMLARDVVRFVGEPVAVVVAESPQLAEVAAELVVVDVEELPVLTSVDDALRDGAPRLHEHATNVLYEASFAAGDVDGAFAVADVVGRSPAHGSRRCHWRPGGCWPTPRRRVCTFRRRPRCRTCYIACSSRCSMYPATRSA